MKPYISYRRYRRGKNRCLECGMKLNDKKHCGGDHKQIMNNVYKYYFSKPIVRLFKKTKSCYEQFSKHKNIGNGYRYEIRPPKHV